MLSITKKKKTLKAVDNEPELRIKSIVIRQRQIGKEKNKIYRLRVRSSFCAIFPL